MAEAMLVPDRRKYLSPHAPFEQPSTRCGWFFFILPLPAVAAMIREPGASRSGFM